MKAIILAAGYATRLYPLTETIAKPLLPVGGRPMIDHLLERLREVEEVDAIHVVTNHKFARAFEDWAPPGVTVHDDGTTSEDDRLGAIGDIAFVVRAVELDDDLLVLAGDNLFDYSLSDFAAWKRAKGEASAVVLYDVGDLELVKRYSSVELAGTERLTSFTEKPDAPRSTLVATAAYLYDRAHVPLLAQYLGDGNPPDQPGRFIAWLVPRVPVFGYTAGGRWRDIGDAHQLLEADNELRAEQGLPSRAEYSVD
ncbi:MAG TPA: nucleotidyltransferase family protein [Gaiellaceae bacterium]|nr:nucleotidyltransferase family protein [Gaiellaceae bacterium]